MFDQLILSLPSVRTPQHLSHLLPKVQGLFKQERLDLMVADMTPMEKQSFSLKQQEQKLLESGHSHSHGPES